MNIKYIKDDYLSYLKSNSEEIYVILKDSVNKDWMNVVLGNDFLSSSKIKIEKLDFIMDAEQPIDSDLDNAKMLFEKLKHINDTQATDERFWVGLSLTLGYDYLIYRWGLEDFTKFKYRWVFYTKNRRSLFYHGLARLWWFTKLTYDESLDNPYELTEFAYSNSEIMKNMVYRNYSNSDTVRKATLFALKKYKNQGNRIVYKTLVEIYKYINFLGGITLLDSYDRDDLENKIYSKLITL